MKSGKGFRQAGRDTVGLTVGIPKRQQEDSSAELKDELDDLIDGLDELVFSLQPAW